MGDTAITYTLNKHLSITTTTQIEPEAQKISKKRPLAPSDSPAKKKRIKITLNQEIIPHNFSAHLIDHHITFSDPLTDKVIVFGQETKSEESQVAEALLALNKLPTINKDLLLSSRPHKSHPITLRSIADSASSESDARTVIPTHKPSQIPSLLDLNIPNPFASVSEGACPSTATRSFRNSRLNSPVPQPSTSTCKTKNIIQTPSKKI